MKPRPCRSVAACLLSILLAGSLVPGQGPDQPVAASVPYRLASGLVVSPGTEAAMAWSEIVTLPGAGSIQLKFADFELRDAADRIVVSSVQDGETQLLDRRLLAIWRNHSAWFNGPAVVVSLHLAPGSRGSVAIEELAAGVPPPIGVMEMSCPDNRVSSTNSKVCRMVSSPTASCSYAVCTGFLIDDQSTVLSAGHCVGGALVVAEFDVPDSTSAGCLNHPNVADQYPVDGTTIRSQNSGIGDDWSVMRLHPNSLGETASDNQGYLSLAASVPVTAVPIRITGYGADTEGPRNHTLQRDSGTLVVSAFDYLETVGAYTQGGNSGGPITRESNGEVIGIHTTGGCGLFWYGTQGTRITDSALQAAIIAVQGCDVIDLADGGQATVTCPRTIFNIDPDGSEWNIVAVTSESYWTVEIEDTFAGNSNGCAFLLANGHLGTVPPKSGVFTRIAGSDDATVRFQSASSTTLTVPGTTSFTTISFTAPLVRLYEFNVTSAGNYDIAVAGTDTSLDWAVFAPGTNSDWIGAWPSAIAKASGMVGDAPVQSVSLGTGWHALVLFPRTSTLPLGLMTLSISICTATPAVNLSTGPKTVSSACADFTLTPAAGKWNAVGISGNGSSWRTAIGTAISSSSTCAFAVADGNAGTILENAGVFSRTSGTTSGRAQAASATSISAFSPFVGCIPASDVLTVLEFSTFGMDYLHVTGDPSLTWHYFEAGSGSSAWRAPNLVSISGSVGGGGATIPELLGQSALVICRTAGAGTATSSFTVNVCNASTPISLSTSATGTTFGGCQPFSLDGTPTKWAAVGIASDSDWNVYLGEASSTSTGMTTDFVVFNAHLGVPASTTGLFRRTSGATTGAADYDSAVTLTAGVSQAVALSASNPLWIGEFEVLEEADYEVRVTGLSSAAWRLFRPGTAVWRPRSDAAWSGTVPGSAQTVHLEPGWYGLVLSRDGTAIAPNLNYLVSVRSNPLPSITSLNPWQVLVGSAATALTVTGTGFVSTSEVRFGATTLATTYVSSTTLSATIPASLLGAIGLNSITVYNPPPEGGTSNSLTFIVLNPMPVLTAVSPVTAPAGGPSITLTVLGSAFNSTSSVRWAGVALLTTFVSEMMLTATVPANYLLVPGMYLVGVFNPAPGGGMTPQLPFTVLPPHITGITPTQVTPMPGGGVPILLMVMGSEFVPASIVFADGMPLATAYVTDTLLQATLPASHPALGVHGGITINVANLTSVVSNPATLVVGSGQNQGNIRLQQLAPPPGYGFSLVVEEGLPGARLTLVADFGSGAPVPGWPDPASDMVVSIAPYSGSPGPLFVLTDGLGLFGPATSTAFNPNGTLVQSGFTMPSPPLGLTVHLQGAYEDPTSPIGVRLTWARWDLDL